MIGSQGNQLPWRQIIDPAAALPEVMLVPEQSEPGKYIAVSADRDVGFLVLHYFIDHLGSLSHLKYIEVRKQGMGFGWAMYLTAIEISAEIGARFCSDRRLSDEADAAWRRFTAYGIARETDVASPIEGYKRLLGYVPRYTTVRAGEYYEQRLHTEVGGDF